MEKEEFKFCLDQPVKTIFGKEGIVTFLGINGEGIKYFVLTDNGSEWYKEEQLTGK